MRRAALLLVASACWRSTPPPEPPIATTPDARPMVDARVYDPAPPDAATLPPSTRTGCPSTLGVAPRIIRMKRLESAGTEVIVGAGKNQLVAFTWYVVEPRNCVIADIAADETRLFCNDRPEQIEAVSPFVLICAP